MHDKGVDGDEEQQADERRKIVTWAKRQGYQVVTQLVGQVSPRPSPEDLELGILRLWS